MKGLFYTRSSAGYRPCRLQPCIYINHSVYNIISNNEKVPLIPDILINQMKQSQLMQCRLSSLVPGRRGSKHHTHTTLYPLHLSSSLPHTHTHTHPVSLASLHFSAIKWVKDPLFLEFPIFCFPG